MTEYQFSVIVAASPASEEGILDAADALGDAGCTDASVRGHAEGMELLFGRSGDTLEAAISSAVFDVERAGYRVARVELERQCLPAH